MDRRLTFSSLDKFHYNIHWATSSGHKKYQLHVPSKKHVQHMSSELFQMVLHILTPDCEITFEADM